MLRLIVNRILVLFITFIGITIVTFFVIHLSPGKPHDISDFNPKISADARSRLEKLYELDKPILIRYFRWLKRVLVLDFGNSFKDDKPVIKKILERLPATLLLNIISLTMIFVFGCVIGILSAYYRGKFFEKLTTIFVFLGYSLPKYWIAILCMLIFGIQLGWLPISGFRSVNWEYLPLVDKIIDIMKHLILPVLISSFGGLAGLTQYVKGSMIEQLNSEYIKFAKSKGTKTKKILFYHAFRNVLIPVVTILGLSLPEIIGGGFIFETIFSYPGMGRLGYEAIMSRDYPLIMGIGTITAVLTLLGNFVADIVYSYVDPRIRYR
jgi:peptide/nickel transport system permease protein